MPFKSLFTKNNVVETFLSVIINPNMELDELAKVYSEKIDSIIRDEQAKKLKYVGGTFKIFYSSEKNFDLAFELYFQDDSGEWVKKSSKSKPQSTEYLSKESLNILRSKKEITYEIDEPEEIKPRENNSEIRKMPKE